MEAFGGLGGIAQYSRDVLRALCAAPQVSEVVAVPRRMPASPESLPLKLTYLTGGLCGQLNYVGAIIRFLIWCAVAISDCYPWPCWQNWSPGRRWY